MAAKPRSSEETLAEGERFVAILAAMRRQLGEVAEMAARDISGHSFRGYHRFRAKLAEHAALVSMTRDRLGSRATPALQQRLEEEDVRATELSIRSTLNFIFALSAIPNLPFGAHETFVDELRALATARERLSRPNLAVPLAEGVLDDLETAQLVLEEVSERAPKLIDWAEAEATA
jgi:hypothetical protein